MLHQLIEGKLDSTMQINNRDFEGGSQGLSPKKNKILLGWVLLMQGTAHAKV